ncbi:F-box and WD repeat domain containing protein 10B isoform X4 [Chionomys nivalis]|uniref:F-box and WD repeat domain containing protein 10B isoform X4 n=1 Tax=Chionomys nivalis TaxID=269649 RepID=UPI0025919718|nr:F-box and WD repeat domain containing protein 10B isoform X4 [Chionomys nivalis]
MENMEPRLKQALYFRCERGLDWVPVCQKCETCVLAWKIFATKEWFRRVSDISQRRFLVSILGQLNSLYLLHYFQNILQTTQGKDFIYNRSRIKFSRKEGKEEKVVKSSLNQMLDKTAEQKMKEILYWFGNSTHRTKANYTLLLLQMCDSKLLLTAADAIRVLFVKEWNNISGLNQDSNNIMFFPEKSYNPASDTSYVYWAAKPKPMSFPMSRPSRNKMGAENEKDATEEKGKSSLQCISEMNKQISGKAGVSRLADDPCNLLLSLDEVQVLSSGSSKYRDFIRYLPLHISKYILRMLDKNSLNKCIFVSQHWAALTQQVKVDLSMHSFIQNQITLLQGSYTRGIDPNYASKVSIPVPKIADDGKRSRSKSQKWKLRTKNDYNLWTAYQNQETQMVQMEERNVFCGTYNIRILSDTKDQNRIIHYTGGDLMAVSSNRKIHLLNIVQAKEMPIEFRGHAGSVRALFLSDEENVLFSGSYDLSIREVLQVSLLYLRVISACGDGKIRIYNFLNGNCLKVIKVDARGDPVLTFFYQGNRMVVQTDSNILLFQFENVKWQYNMDRGKAKKSKDKEEEREEMSTGNMYSKSSMQIHSLRESMSSKQELLSNKPPKARIYPKLNMKPSSEIYDQGKASTPQRDGKKRDGGVLEDALEKHEEADDVESPVEEIRHPMKKFWKVPMTPDRLLLTVNALQQAHNSEEFAYPHRPQTAIIDAWGPSIPYPRKVLSFKGKSVQHAVGQLRSSNLPTDVKQTNIPLEIQKLQPNLKQSLHSPRVQSTIPQPRLIRSRMSDSLRGEEQLTSSIDGAMRRAGPLTSMQVIKPNRMLAPRGGTATLTLKKERPRFYTTLDPLRMNTGFMLLTVKEEKEYGEAKMKEYQASESTKVVDPGKASKAAWIRKIKGLPIDNFMKQGKTAAPELGQNVFI